jgi:hypothetical protein
MRNYIHEASDDLAKALADQISGPLPGDATGEQANARAELAWSLRVALQAFGEAVVTEANLDRGDVDKEIY